MFRAFTALLSENFVARILMALGISFLSYQGIDLVLSLLSDEIHAQISVFPGNVSALAGLADIDRAINLLLSGYSARAAMAGLTRFVIQ